MTTLWTGEQKCIKATWDLSVSGAGTVAAHEIAQLPEGFVVSHMDIDVVTALTGGGTCTLGDGVDADGYSADMDAFTGVSNGKGALVWNSTDKHAIPCKITSSTKSVVVTVGTTAYTAGKVDFYFYGVQGR